MDTLLTPMDLPFIRGFDTLSEDPYLVHREVAVNLFRHLFVPVLTVCSMAMAQPPAQQPNQGGRGGGAGAQSNPQSNEAGGVDIDRFIGVAADSPVHLSQ